MIAANTETDHSACADRCNDHFAESFATNCREHRRSACSDDARRGDDRDAAYAAAAAARRRRTTAARTQLLPPISHRSHARTNIDGRRTT
jgi:hypothetical protein